MKSWVKMLFSPTQKIQIDDNLYEKIELLNKRVDELEKNNNELIKTLQDFSRKIDNIQPVIYNIHERKKST